MCVLEMVTVEYPYQECSNAAQIWRKVSAGVKPAVMHRIQDHDVHEFVDLCLLPAALRPSAEELLKHPFLALRTSDPRDNLNVRLGMNNTHTHTHTHTHNQNQKPKTKN